MSRVASEGALFRQVLADEWLELHPDIQARFAKDPAPGQPLYYQGELSELSCSWWAKLLAYLVRPLIQGALIPYNQTQVPVAIQVYALPQSPKVFKQRIYRLHGRKPIQFTSYMDASESGEVLEYVGAGLGMKLKLQVRDGNLHFSSDGYFWQLGRFRLPLPALLTPGHTDLCHINQQANQFRIRIEIRHCLFGLGFIQAGVFREISAAEAHRLKEEL